MHRILLPSEKAQPFDDTTPVRIGSLSEYAKKRNFEQTPEPQGLIQNSSENRYVIQKHQATQLHYDLRLERDGVLKSWAVPKGVPEDTGIRRLAIQVEDHPVDYATFEGKIPPGQYGAGTVQIWDHGVYHMNKWTDEKIEVVFRGQRLHGPYALVKMKTRRNNEWLILKMREKTEQQNRS
jgi:DNA ligase D-like protein (predicted 3'-phosphoesterase)